MKKDGAPPAFAGAGREPRVQAAPAKAGAGSTARSSRGASPHPGPLPKGEGGTPFVGKGKGRIPPKGERTRLPSEEPAEPLRRFFPAKEKPKVTISRAWNFLPANIAEVVTRLAFVSPTPVQSECLPAALAGESFLAVAPTGTGKTLTYLLPLWARLPSPHGNLILVPTRELGYQVSQMLQEVDPRAREGIVLCLGGHDQDSQQKRLAGQWHTVIATPGRLVDNLTKDPAMLRSVRFLVVDEFDRLIDMGFEEQVGQILAKVPKKRQTLLFSATGAKDALERLPLGDLARHQVKIGKTAPLTEQFYLLKSNRTKNDLLVAALKETKAQALVFVANREKANHLNGLLRLRGFTAGALHGDRLQSERAAAYQDFKDGKIRVLVATDLAARGLDVAEVDLVVNFDLPRNYREYVHRSGRTARRKRPGTCLSYAGPEDFLPFRNIEREFGEALPFHPDYAQLDPWLASGRRVHDAKVRVEKKAEFIRAEQGLPEAPKAPPRRDRSRS
jgi:superfamily II DNA/RNA helicase